MDTAQQRRAESDLHTRFSNEDMRQFKGDVKAVMRTKEGRRLLICIGIKGGIFRYSQRDDDHSYVNGKRDGALEILHTTRRIAPAETALAQQERDKLEMERNTLVSEVTQ